MQVIWGLRLAALVGATFRSSLFARPCGGKAAWGWPFGPLLHIAKPAGAPRPAKR